MGSSLATILRENITYLIDTQWSHTACLLATAADEIDRLSARVAELENHLPEDEFDALPSTQ